MSISQSACTERAVRGTERTDRDQEFGVGDLNVGGGLEELRQQRVSLPIAAGVVRPEKLLCKEGIRAEVLTADTPPEQREAWYERQLRSGMQVCICHPKLVQTGLDYVEYEGGG